MDNRRMNNGRMAGSMQQPQPCPKSPMPARSVPVETMSLIDNLSLAMAYVPWQHWCEVYCPERALECGTLFPELNKPFCGRRER